MLSNNTIGTSSIQTRRRQQQQKHQRHESLEVPVLNTKLSGNTSTPQQSPTRGGMSQEQLQSTTLSPTFGRLTTSQEDTDTNLGQIPQHIKMQGAQQHSAAQPGLRHPRLQPHQQQRQMDPRMMHPQMIQQMMREQQAAARQALAAQQQNGPVQAMRNIQSQIQSFHEQYPGYTATSPQAGSPMMEIPQGRGPMMNGATTPIMMPRSCTPPNGFLPTPPTTTKTHGRITRQMDSAPMPINFGQVPVLAIPQTGGDMQLFSDNAPFGSEYGYSPSYQSSMVDPNSPQRSPEQEVLRSMSIPGMYEDGSGMMPSPEMMQQQHQHHQMMMAAAAAQGYYFHPDSPMRIPLSPREALLASLEVDASIEDTGISAEEVAAYISQQDAVDMKWTCLFPECGKKFGRKENIRSHVQTHLGDRQFKCNHCGKCFVRQHDLKRHAKIHSGDKPHKCPCGNGFARQDALTRHRQRGVCRGALPGFERKEAKRGRPRKNRPELSERRDKASRARQLDAADDEDGADSSSSPSESGASDPYTPPAMGDDPDDVFGADLGTNAGIEAFIKAYQDDTPPTSPATGGRSNMSSRSGPPSFTAAFDFAASSSREISLSPQHSPTAGSPRRNATPPPQNTQTFDFASQVVSPKQLHSTHASPEMRAIHDSPLVAEHDSPAVGGAMSMSFGGGSSMSQPEPSPFNTDYGFDWGAIETQPSLVADAFSPAAGSSPAATDLFGDELVDGWDLGKVGSGGMMSGLDGFGKVGVVGADGDDRVDELFGELMGELEWVN